MTAVAAEPLVLRAVFRTPTDRLLPAMVTTALHGALGHALKQAGCTRAQPDRCARSCLEPGSCAYAQLFEPRRPRDEPAQPQVDGSEEEVPGESVPSPVVLAPWEPVLTDRPRRLEAGGSVSVRITLLGGAAPAERALLASALRAAAARGLGRSVDGPGSAGPMVLETLEPVGLSTLPPPEQGQARLELLSPLRLKSQGKITSHFDGRALWAGLLRRASLLHDLYGLALPSPVDGDAPFEIVRAETRLLRIRRHSARQGRSMVWPGIVGTLHVQGDAARMRQAWPWLELGARVQLGKGASFGFGRFTAVAT